MRIGYILCLLLALLMPAAAADSDQNLKREMEAAVAEYAAGIAKLDPAGMAAQYSAGGVLINPRGVQTDLIKWYEGVFKAGINHLENSLEQFWPIGPDAVLSTGEYRATGKSPSGAALESTGRWTSVSVRENGKWKMRMLVAFPKSPPPSK